MEEGDRLAQQGRSVTPLSVLLDGVSDQHAQYPVYTLLVVSDDGRATVIGFRDDLEEWVRVWTSSLPFEGEEMNSAVQDWLSEHYGDVAGVEELPVES